MSNPTFDMFLGEVNRIEVIDWTKSGTGRDFVKWIDSNFVVGVNYQDDGRTMKIFLTEKREKNV